MRPVGWWATWQTRGASSRGGEWKKIEHKRFTDEATARAWYARLCESGTPDWARLEEVSQ